MKSRMVQIILVTVLVLGFSSIVSAQNLNNVLNKLQILETRLEQIETKPQSDLADKIENVEVNLATFETRNRGEINKLNGKIEELSDLRADTDLESFITPLQARVDQLQKDIIEIKNAAVQQGEDENFGLLVADLGGLVDELRTTIENPPVIVQDTPATAQNVQEQFSYEITGFGDFFYNVGNDNKENTRINIGQAELDLEIALNEKIDFVTALVFDSEGEVFGLGDLFMDFHLFGSEGDHLHAVSGIDHSGILVGLFDVPFGIDYNFYDSIDRKTFSGPLVIENTHDFWGDFGVQAYFKNQKYNTAVYATNGFGYGEVEMKIALGGRFGFTPFPGVEIGTSYASFLNENNTSDIFLRGFDFQGEYRAVFIKGEYIEHSIGVAGNDKVINSGFYFQGTYDFGKYFLVERYGMFTPDGGKDITRISSGCGYVIREGLELRVEYQVNSEEENQTFFQIVLGL